MVVGMRKVRLALDPCPKCPEAGWKGKRGGGGALEDTEAP
jgi:hypothetical protein